MKRIIIHSEVCRLCDVMWCEFDVTNIVHVNLLYINQALGDKKRFFSWDCGSGVESSHIYGLGVGELLMETTIYDDK